MIRVVIADDQSLVRAGFHMIVDATDDMSVVGEAADGLQALAVADRTQPDVVLMDVRMPGIDGIEATRRLRAACPPDRPPYVIILTTFDLDEYVYAGLRAGAAGSCSRTRSMPNCCRPYAPSLAGTTSPPRPSPVG